MANNNDCSCGITGCCSSDQTKKKLDIEFLYLDLNTCERCKSAQSNLDEAIKEVSTVLKAAGYEISISKINITSSEMAIEHEFISSPTIKINGSDIALNITETACTDCGDICGDSVDCRSWVYDGVEHPDPPKEMIVNAIMKSIYGGNLDVQNKKSDYVLPENLKIFFDGIKSKK